MSKSKKHIELDLNFLGKDDDDVNESGEVDKKHEKEPHALNKDTKGHKADSPSFPEPDKHQEKEPSSLSKTIANNISVIFVVAVVAVTVLMVFIVAKQERPSTTKAVTNLTTNETQTSNAVLPKTEDKPVVFKLISDLNDLYGTTVVRTIKIGAIEFKIYPGQNYPSDYKAGYFKINKNEENIFSNEHDSTGTVYGLIDFQYGNSRYVLIQDYSGGAHCCWTINLFKVDLPDRVKHISSIDLGNGLINSDSLIFKNNTLYLKIPDDRYAYFHTGYASSFFFDQYYKLDGDKLILTNNDFRDEFLQNASTCKNNLNATNDSGEKDFGTWFSNLTCYVTYLLLGEKRQFALEEFDSIYQKYSGGRIIKDEYSGEYLSSEKLKSELLHIYDDKAYANHGIDRFVKGVLGGLEVEKRGTDIAAEYSCPDALSYRTEAIKPSENIQSIKEAQQEIELHNNEIDRLKIELEKHKVYPSLPQYEIDRYNKLVNSYNAKLTSFKRDLENYNLRVDRFNAQVNAYNDYLGKNCTRKR